MKLSLSADSLFDFDKAAIKPQSTWSLDMFVSDLKGLEYDVITVTGHTDRIGSHAYNMKLSTRRAEAVKAYLVVKGINSRTIEAVGYGESQPIADNSTEEGRAANRRIDFEVLEGGG